MYLRYSEYFLEYFLVGMFETDLYFRHPSDSDWSSFFISPPQVIQSVFPPADDPEAFADPADDPCDDPVDNPAEPWAEPCDEPALEAPDSFAKTLNKPDTRPLMKPAESEPPFPSLQF